MRHLRKMTAKYSASLMLGGALALGSAALLSGCNDEPDTPGEAVDDAADSAGDAIDDAGDATGDAIDDAGDAIDDNTNG
jgi:hypothetical protein